MKNIKIFIVIFIAGISVLGIFVVQYIWIYKARELRQEQFDYLVNKHLKDIIYRVGEQKLLNYYKQRCPDSLLNQQTIQVSEDDKKMLFQVLDTIIKSEFPVLVFSKEFTYALIDNTTGKFVIEKDTNQFVDELRSSSYKISLSTVFPEDNFILSVYFLPQPKESTSWVFQRLLLLTGLLFLIFLACFLAMIILYYHLRKHAEIRSNFINNISHELRTPISTISLSTEILMKADVCKYPEKVYKYANIIYDENNRLRNQVDQVLQVAVLNKKLVTFNFCGIDIHQTIENVVDLYRALIKDKGGIIQLNLMAKNNLIIADELHVINVVTNLLDNAIKYTKEVPFIKISSLDKDKGMIILFEDNGIGISACQRKNIFKEFYRIHTGDIHNVKGFGLGLYYVNFIMEAHKGKVSLVKCALGKGSVFELYFKKNFIKTP